MITNNFYERTILTSKNQCARIIEVVDFNTTIEDLKGDCFKPEVNPETHPKMLKREELIFEQRVEIEGIYGYQCQFWDPTPNCGWKTVDSCYGFVGRYDEKNNAHDIVEEMKRGLE